MMIGDDMVKVLAWYDNEWGYSSRIADLAELFRWPEKLIIIRMVRTLRDEMYAISFIHARYSKYG